MKIAKIALILIAAVAVLGAGGLYWLQHANVAGLVEFAAKKQGYNVQAQGPVYLKLWPKGSLSLGQISVKDAQGQPLLSLQSGQVEWLHGLLPWQNIRLTQVALANPVVTLVKRKDGSANWMTASEQEQAVEEETPETAPLKAPQLPLNMLATLRLQVQNLNLTYNDQTTGSHIAAKNVNFNVQTSGTVAITTLNGQVNGQNIEGRMQVDIANLANVPLTIKASAAGLNIAADGRIIKQQEFAGQINAQTANLKQSLATLMGKAPAQVPAQQFKLVGDTTLGAKQITLRNFSTQLGDLLQASGDASVNMGDKPSATGTIRAQGNNLRQLAELLLGAPQANIPASPFLLTTKLSGKDAIELNDIKLSLDDILTLNGDVKLVPQSGHLPQVDAQTNLTIPNVQKFARAMGRTGTFPEQTLKAQIALQGANNIYTLPNFKAQLDNTADVQGNMQITLSDPLKINGAVKMEGGNLKTAAAGFGVDASSLPASPFKASASISGQGTMTVKDLDLDLPGLLEATGKADITPGKPLNLNGSLSVTQLNATALGYCSTGAQASSAAASASPAPASSGAAPWSDKPIDLSSLQAVAFDLTLSGKGIQCARFPVSSLQAHITNTPSQLDLQQFAVTMPNNGTLTLAGHVQHAGTPNAVITVDGKNIPLQMLVPVLASRGVKLPLNVNGSLNTQGDTSREMAQNLMGTVQATSEQGTIPYGNLIGTVSNLANLAQGISQTTAASNGNGNVENLKAAFTIKNGIVSTDTMQADTGNGAMTLTGTGTINLPQWQIDYTLTPTVNAGNGLAIPVAVKGPLTAPNIGPDADYLNRLTSRLATQGVKKLLGTGKENAKGIGGALGDVLTGKGVTSGTVNNLLNNFLGK